MLESDPHNVDALCDRAEVYLKEEMYDEAIRDYQTANENEQDYHSSCNVSTVVAPVKTNTHNTSSFLVQTNFKHYWWAVVVYLRTYSKQTRLRRTSDNKN